MLTINVEAMNCCYLENIDSVLWLVSKIDLKGNGKAFEKEEERKKEKEREIKRKKERKKGKERKRIAC